MLDETANAFSPFKSNTVHFGRQGDLSAILKIIIFQPLLFVSTRWLFLHCRDIYHNLDAWTIEKCYKTYLD